MGTATPIPALAPVVRPVLGAGVDVAEVVGERVGAGKREEGSVMKKVLEEEEGLYWC
jgi:hypothetical protein